MVGVSCPACLRSVMNNKRRSQSNTLQYGDVFFYSARHSHRWKVEITAMARAAVPARRHRVPVRDACPPATRGLRASHRDGEADATASCVRAAALPIRLDFPTVSEPHREVPGQSPAPPTCQRASSIADVFPRSRTDSTA